jgi:hypothetical protein
MGIFYEPKKKKKNEIKKKLEFGVEKRHIVSLGKKKIN